MEAVTGVRAPGTSWYNAVWRWHVYAGLFCLPFVLWLSVTGTLYLWKPQIEAWQERAYDHLPVTATRATPEAIVATALAAVPGASLHKYQLPQGPGRAVRVLVGGAGPETRVYVDPYRLRVLGAVREDGRLMAVVSRLHGTLLAGNPGSWLVEIAACWTITMLLTGLYLWWPRGSRGLGAGGLGGILYPRWRSGRRLFWRDTHAVAGVWVSVAAMFLIATGLPWANAWGGYLTAVRTATGTTDGPIDWPTGARPRATPGSVPPSTMPGTMPGTMPRTMPGTMLGDHADHGGTTMAHRAPRPGELDRVVTAVAPLGIAAPVMVAPPQAGAASWTVASDAANRPLRTKLTVDGATGMIVSCRDFAQRQWIDRVVGYGIAIHEGAFFGLANQIIGTLVTALLATLSISGAVMWWRRRRPGTLGAPVRLSRPRYGWGLAGAIGALGVAMPLFGATLLGVLAIDRFAGLRRA